MDDPVAKIVQCGEVHEMATKLVGQNYTTPDLAAKVTGQAKYAEDSRLMLLKKFVLARLISANASTRRRSPRTHGRWRRPLRY